jgi:DNA-binding NtrC family response regulator
MERLYALSGQISKLEGLILLQGEPSVGKTTFARALHEQHGQGELVKVRGHEVSPEAWRVAVRRAQGGTLYVSNLDQLPTPQRAALRSMGERVIGSAPGGVDGLSPVASILIPPLRDRRAEILPLAESFMARAAHGLGMARVTLTREAREILANDSWPGNLRELKTAMVRAVLIAVGAEVGAEHLPPRVLREARAADQGADLRTTLDEAERATLREMLNKTAWNVSAAAKALGMPRRTVVYRMAKLGMRRPQRGEP